MPTCLPVKAQPQTRQAGAWSAPHVLSCVAASAVATALALLTGWACADPVGALFTLATSGAVIAVILRAGRRPL